jgi:hypothetical protein
MKRTLVYLGLLLPLFFLITACGNDDEPQAEPAMSALVDSDDWRANVATGTILQGKLNITGTSLQEAIILVAPAEVGTHSIGQLETNTITLRPTLGGAYVSNLCTGAEGTITITKLENDLASGTFNATVCRADGTSKTITNGRFTNVKLQ